MEESIFKQINHVFRQQTMKYVQTLQKKTFDTNLNSETLEQQQENEFREYKELEKKLKERQEKIERNIAARYKNKRKFNDEDYDYSFDRQKQRTGTGTGDSSP
jgi:chaperonin cofactor prefoldin